MKEEFLILRGIWKMDIYDKHRLNELLDEDEINEQEEAFMHGYLNAFRD